MINLNTNIKGERELINNQNILCNPPALMTESELIQFLRIPQISKAKDFSYVIENLKRMRDLPCVHVSRQPLYPHNKILEWIDQQCDKEKS
jgi:hypothetical protein